MALPALIGLGLGAYGAYQGAKQQRKADQLNDRSLAMSEEQYADRAPFRQYATQGLSQLGARDSSGIFGDPGNPYAAARDYTTDMGAQQFTPAPVNPMAAQMGELDRAESWMMNHAALPDGLKARMQAQFANVRNGLNQGPQSAPPQSPAPQPFPASAPQSMPPALGGDPRRALSQQAFLQMLQMGRGGR